MKNYLLFAGYTYYPDGGWGDFQEAFDSLEEAKAVVAGEAGKNWDWAEVVALSQMKVIAHWQRGTGTEWKAAPS
jgi:hypothetical protein